MKLAVIDLDGVIADPAERFKRAEEAKQAFLNDKNARLEAIFSDGSAGKQRATEIYWRTVFTPELVSLDTLIEGVHEALNMLYGEYGVMFLTSRPESMRAATHAWLEAHDISVEHPQFGDFLVMKPPAAQYVKTVVWKALTIQMLVALHGADEALVIDDEKANLAEMQKYDVSRMRLCSSLAEAIAPPEEGRPF